MEQILVDYVRKVDGEWQVVMTTTLEEAVWITTGQHWDGAERESRDEVDEL